MNKEIKEILEDFKNDVENNLFIEVRGIYYEPLLDYINNLQTIEREYSSILSENAELQQEIKEANDSITWWSNRYKAVERDNGELKQENERLKEALNCKEYFSSTMPEDTEFVILTKNNYDRQQKDIQFELIDYKSRFEKAIEYTEKQKKKMYKSRNKIALFVLMKLENILQGEDKQ